MKTRTGNEWDTYESEVQLDVERGQQTIMLTADDMIAMLQELGHTYRPPRDLPAHNPPKWGPNGIGVDAEGRDDYNLTTADRLTPTGKVSSGAAGFRPEDGLDAWEDEGGPA